MHTHILQYTRTHSNVQSINKYFFPPEVIQKTLLLSGPKTLSVNTDSKYCAEFLGCFCLKNQEKENRSLKGKVSATLLDKTVFKLTYGFLSLRKGRTDPFPFPFGEGDAGRL